MSKNDRKDRLTAQRVEVGLVFKEMLSNEDAEQYLTTSGVPRHVIERVLKQDAFSHRTDDDSDPFKHLCESEKNRDMRSSTSVQPRDGPLQIDVSVKHDGDHVTS